MVNSLIIWVIVFFFFFFFLVLYDFCKVAVPVYVIWGALDRGKISACSMIGYGCDCDYMIGYGCDCDYVRYWLLFVLFFGANGL